MKKEKEIKVEVQKAIIDHPLNFYTYKELMRKYEPWMIYQTKHNKKCYFTNDYIAYKRDKAEEERRKSKEVKKWNNTTMTIKNWEKLNKQ